MEDDIAFGELLRASLEEAGHSVVLRFDGASAQSYFEKHGADVVLTDIIIKQDQKSIPDGGLLLISRIRGMSSESARSVPIIAMSGATSYPGMQGALTTAEALGATVSINKPFSPDELTDLIDDLLP
ncbi:response regulator [Roseobacter weihaiensis]|uniref:response regulator n=1 Tax=Roseobacter weihaiensis TaxID=2763262 RepID=UPI001D0B6FAE|nr:response regulator [Roseobacter sp. H9]